ncbi:MAG: PAS domain-containing sensor histidine kinase [Acidocella sp.]|nr:PAS domain-containing sensor histidine kinase [Acidocella sp.]
MSAAMETDQPNRSWATRALDIALGRVSTLLLASVALLLGIATFAILAGRVKLGVHSSVAIGMSVADFAALLLLIIILVGRVTRVVLERRQGAAGARLHVRLVLLFGGVAAVPAILVAVFATVFFNIGIQAWFNARVQTALDESNQVAQGYLAEHTNDIRLDALAIANDLSQNGTIFYGDATGFANFLVQQTATRGLTQAVIFEPVTGQVIASAGLLAGMGATIPSQAEIASARAGQVVVISAPDSTLERAVIQLDSTPPLMLLIERPIDPAILDHVQKTEAAVAEYQRLSQNRNGLEISFALIFATVALLVLSAAVLIGLVIANQIAKPIGHLMRAAERVRAGDLTVRVPETTTGDEVAGLSRAFNRMTGQLAAQRAELMVAYGQLDERRRFTETVLAGVSAGVIGLDAQGRIELPNRAASEFLGVDLQGHLGEALAEVVPEFAPMIEAVTATPDKPMTAEIEHGPAMQKRVLLVRIGAELKAGLADGFIVTFDDVTELLSAQRKAAWADVARRIAHEIKNPLTPIQLSAERLKRRFSREITSDVEGFAQCADTIVRHVGDIGRMVDEFSTFARMPAPVMKSESLERIVREALVLQRVASRHIDFQVEIADPDLRAFCDRRLIGQALTNLLQNAVDAVAMRPGAHIVKVQVFAEGQNAVLRVIDDGIGLPETDRGKLMEPYVTHKAKGTGLGLAIVRKIMEDHGGQLDLDEAPGGQGAMVSLVLPALATAASEPNLEALSEDHTAQ